MGHDSSGAKPGGEVSAGNLSHRLGLSVLVAGLMISLDWIVDIRSIQPGWVTMKLTTALGFAVCGWQVMLFRQWRGFAASLSIATTLVVFSLLVSAVGGVETPLEKIVIESPDAPMSVRPGVPSIGTLACFQSLAASAWLCFRGVTFASRVLSASVIAMGSIALVGYLFSQPALYFFVDGYSTAMAFLTAVLFVVLGVSHWRLSSEDV